VQLDIIQLTALQISTEQATTYTRHNGVQSRTQMLMNHPQRQSSTQIIGGITCKIEADPNDPHRALKLKLLRLALTSFQGNAALALPQNKMHVYLISSTTNPQTATSNMSVGFVYKKLTADPHPRVALILGDSIGTATGTQLLCDDVASYYRPTFTISARERRGLTAIYHEFGHIFHQLQSASHYYAMADLIKLFNAGAGAFMADPAYASFANAPSFADISSFRQAVVDWGQTVSQYASSHPNEFVAETFSGLMVGAPVQAGAEAAYQVLGGVVPPTGVRHHRSGRNAFKRRILYPVAKAIRDIGS
jgi:hypothetical protein